MTEIRSSGEMTNLRWFLILTVSTAATVALVVVAKPVHAGDDQGVRSAATGNPGVAAAAAKETADAGPAAAPGHSPIHETELRIARSENGIDFTDTDAIVARAASAPDLVRLHNGTLLALFDWADGEVADPDEKQTVIAASFSKDAGRSWSSPRPIQIRTRFGTPGIAEHAALLRMPGGLLRLYYVTKEGRVRDREPVSPARRVVMGAISHDGLTYRVDPRVQIEVDSNEDVHPMAAVIDSHVHLFIGSFGSGTQGHETAPRRAWHYLSPTGRRFTKLDEPLPKEAAFVGSVIHGRFGTRAYVSSGNDIVSYRSKDGWRFAAEEGVRLPNGWDPATLRLRDGSYLMIYCASATEKSKASSRVVDAGMENFNTTDRAGGELAFDDNGTGTLRSDASEVDRGTLGEPQTTPDDSANAAVAEAFDGDPLAGGQHFLAPPRPDFANPVDYFDWYRRFALRQTADNAYDAYEVFMPNSFVDKPEPDWPEFRDMFNDRDHEGPPGPWDAAEHPDWAASNQAARDVLDQFREATLHEGYSSGILLSKEAIEDAPDGKPLLLSMLLTQLGPHRKLVRATLADAWRLEDGKVSPDRMLDAWRTSLRGADHLYQGATLIENLVGMAETNAVQETARWALQRGVFAGDELESALDVLMELDTSHIDTRMWMRGEYAVAMDTTQRVFSWDADSGTITPNLELLEEVVGLAGGEDPQVDAIGAMTSEDVEASIDAFDDYYRTLTDQMTIGYPTVRASDITETFERYGHTTPWNESMLPALSRVYQIRTRSVASRRATKLAYATHVFKDRHGRWPESLAELPGELGETIRTDPFTGDYFGYLIDETGPRIYSRSENGIDDGGVHSERWGGNIANDFGSDDYVFWPPQP